MTLDDELRSHLHDKADTIDLGAAPIGDVRRRSRKRSRRQQAGFVCATLAVLAGGAFGLRTLAGDGDRLDLATEEATTQTDEDEGSDTPDDAPATDSLTADAASSVSRDRGVSGYGGPQWVVPWGDGFISFGMIYEPQPIPEFTEDLAALFPAEIQEAVQAAGATNIDEAMEALSDAGLLDQATQIVLDNPDAYDAIYGEPIPPRFEAQTSPDGLEWTDLDGFSLPAGGENISQVASDGSHLVVVSQTWEEPEPSDDGSFDYSYGPGTTTSFVSVTTDLASWTTHEIPSDQSEANNDPPYVYSETSVGNLAIGPNGWLIVQQTYAWIDEWALLPEEIRDQSGGGWGSSTNDEGIVFDVFPPYEGGTIVESASYSDASTERAEEVLVEYPVIGGDCCEPAESHFFTWKELGITQELYESYMYNEHADATVWTASWGGQPTSSEAPGLQGWCCTIAGTDDGFVALSQAPDEGTTDILFSPDGSSWSTAHTLGTGVWVNSISSVAAGVVISGNTQTARGSVLWLADADGSNWTPIEVPGLDENAWIDFYGSSGGTGVATIVDLQVYDDYAPEAFDVDFVVEHGGYSIAASVSSGGNAGVTITDTSTGEVVLERIEQVSSDVPSFVTETDDLYEFRGDDESVIVAVPIDVFETALEDAYEGSEITDSRVDEYRPDFWLVATANGLDWLVEDLDDGSFDEFGYWPQATAINGNVVVVKLSDTWSRYEIG